MFITNTLVFNVIIIPKITYSFRFIIIFLLFKKCFDISNYSIRNYFFILLLFFLSSFSFSVSKRVQRLIMLYFSLSIIIFDFFHITFCLINRSNQFLLIRLIFLNSCSSNLSISSLDTIIGLKNSFSISLSIFFSIFQFSIFKFF